MSKSLISTGINPNDGNGDTLLSGATKVNSNFNEIYSSIGDGSNINIGTGKTVISTNSFGNVGIGTTNSLAALQIVRPGSVALLVEGDSRITGILTVGTASVTIDGDNSSVQVGSSMTISQSGILMGETDLHSNGLDVLNLNVSGISTFSGNLGIGTTNPTSKLQVIGNALITGITTVGLGSTSTPSNSQLSFELTSDTNLRIKVRGSDGVLRSANITLS